MGFFSKKPKKNGVYSLQNAMELIEKYPEYSAVEVKDGFKLMHSEETKQEINRLKARRKEFINKINGNGTYNNEEKINVRRYEPYNYQNNYQNYDNVR